MKKSTKKVIKWMWINSCNMSNNLLPVELFIAVNERCLFRGITCLVLVLRVFGIGFMVSLKSQF